MAHPHACLDCDGPGTLPLVYDTGEMYGWLCEPCDQKRRRKRMGWRGRAKRSLRRLFDV